MSSYFKPFFFSGWCLQEEKKNRKTVYQLGVNGASILVHFFTKRQEKTLLDVTNNRWYGWFFWRETYWFIYLFQREIDKERGSRERQRDLATGSSLIWLGLGQVKTKGLVLLCVSHMCGWGSSTFAAAFSGTLAVSCIRSGAAGLKSALMWDAHVSSSTVSCCTIMQTPTQLSEHTEIHSHWAMKRYFLL